MLALRTLCILALIAAACEAIPAQTVRVTGGGSRRQTVRTTPRTTPHRSIRHRQHYRPRIGVGLHFGLPVPRVSWHWCSSCRTRYRGHHSCQIHIVHPPVIHHTTVIHRDPPRTVVVHREPRVIAYEEHWSSGLIRVRGSLCDSQRTGSWTWYDEQGTRLTAGTYDDGLETGTWNWWYDHGQLRETGNYSCGVKLGVWRRYYRNGQLEQESRFGGDGQLNGPWRRWYADGTLEEDGQYRHGLRTGTWSSYHPIGTLHTQSIYHQGQLHGHYQAYHTNGQLAETGLYREGLRQGLWTTYHPGGRMATRGRYVDGAPHGTWEYWDEHGRVLDAPGPHRRPTTGTGTGRAEPPQPGAWKQLTATDDA